MGRRCSNLSPCCKHVKPAYDNSTVEDVKNQDMNEIVLKAEKIRNKQTVKEKNTETKIKGKTKHSKQKEMLHG